MKMVIKNIEFIKYEPSIYYTFHATNAFLSMLYFSDSKSSLKSTLTIKTLEIVSTF